MSWNRPLKPDLTSSQNLALGALSYVTAIGRKFRVENVILRASVPITETITITLDSINGANYDTVLHTSDLIDGQDFVWRPQGELNLQNGDEIRVQCTNANLVGTVYLTVKLGELV